jgi:Zn-dependent peptidase ImmA (M78 family)
MQISTIDILGLTYTVEEVPVVDKDEHKAGQIEYAKQRILIDADLRPDRKIQTLLHEILHGVLEQLGEDGLNEDEGKVQALAMGLYLTLKPYIAFKERR